MFSIFFIFFFVFVSVSGAGLRWGNEQFQQPAKHEN